MLFDDLNSSFWIPLESLLINWEVLIVGILPRSVIWKQHQPHAFLYISTYRLFHAIVLVANRKHTKTSRKLRFSRRTLQSTALPSSCVILMTNGSEYDIRHKPLAYHKPSFSLDCCRPWELDLHWLRLLALGTSLQTSQPRGLPWRFTVRRSLRWVFGVFTVSTRFL